MPPRDIAVAQIEAEEETSTTLQDVAAALAADSATRGRFNQIRGLGLPVALAEKPWATRVDSLRRRLCALR